MKDTGCRLDKGERGYDRRSSEGWEGVERKSSRSLLSEWILQLSSGECAGIPQSLLPKNAVIPNGSTNSKIETPASVLYVRCCTTKKNGYFSNYMH